MEFKKSYLIDFFNSSGDTWIVENNTGEDNSSSPLLDDFQQLVSKGELISQVNNKRTLFTVPEIDQMENEIASLCIKHKYSKSCIPFVSEDKLNYYIEDFEKKESLNLGFEFHLAFEQKEAVKMAMRENFMVLTGGPGTGKTCVLKAIKSICQKIYSKAIIQFCAPTGKAARRITESTGSSACTIQKKMHLTLDSNIPSTISCDVLIVDEISMLDLETMNSLMWAVTMGTKLILVGDTDQLPSVGFGSVLRDLIQSYALPVTKLEETFRQAQDSNIFTNITYLRKGFGELETGDDFYLIDGNNDNGQDKIISTYLDSISEWGLSNVICLTPYRRKGNTCANIINKIMQEKINPVGPSLSIFIPTENQQFIYRENDPVMQLVNREEVANGDVGVIEKVYEKSLSVKFIDCSVLYEIDDLDQLDLAYAMSVHKSQGSEYKCVITTCLSEHEDMLDRNMLYTAVTRAKKVCKIIGDRKVIENAVKHETSCKRVTLLAEKISNEDSKMKLITQAFKLKEDE